MNSTPGGARGSGPARTRPLARLLRDRNAALQLTGAVVSGLGTSALWLATGVWVKDLTGSDGLAALSLLAMWAPTLAGPVLGALADRVRRKPLLIGTNLLMAALLPTLLTVDAPGDVWLLFAVLFVYGAAGVVQDAAESALVATALDPALLGDFNGLRTTVTEGMKLIAPLAGAGVYAAYGGAGVALLDAATFLVATGLYAALRVRERPPAAGRRASTPEGVRLLCAHPRLRPLVLAGGTTMLCAGLNGALLYAVVERLGHPPAYAGVLAALQGLGSVAVGLASGTALRRLGERRFAAAGIALTGVAVALRAVPYDAAAWAGSVAVGAGLPCVLIAALTAVQRGTPEGLVGRTAATASTLMFAPNVLGLAVGAALVELLPHQPLLLLLGLALLATPLQLRASAARTAARSPSDANPA
ncbi:MFS transporter [Streptomyces chromofuscus]|uniref:MFS transporter n=1 Tax=Streptomyces chromofuscus TaxID=42881 RepID=A0A7M2TFJ7_STRCW|nr:MFS transporter [Streptomyces chromofuscus]QOV47517.1 MFS transporter [Streptomyces chromofuscus]